LDDVGNLIDSAGMCVDTSYYEGSPLVPFADNSNRSYERLPGGSNGSGQDTDNNSADFAVREVSDPQDLCSPAVPPVSSTVDVDIQDFFFQPMTKTISVGQAVRWTNQGTAPHTSTSGTPPVPDGLWDSGTLNPGNSFTHTFSTAGTFHYYCAVHPFMEGDIVVLAGPPCAATPTPTDTPTATP